MSVAYTIRLHVPVCANLDHQVQSLCGASDGVIGVCLLL